MLQVDPSTPKGKFALGGGDDGTPPRPGGLGEQLGTKDTVFHLTELDGVLDCGDTVTEGGEGAPAVELIRGATRTAS